MRDTFSEIARAIPATGKLLYRLVRDERVDEKKRLAAVGAFAYAILPFDLIPDRFPIIGRVDDVVIGAAAILALLEEAGDDIVAEHWDAADSSLDALRSGVEVVAGLVPRPLRRLLRPAG
jgi:uncharacterized membrane protein YkvA (DUF1232 family)